MRSRNIVAALAIAVFAAVPAVAVVKIGEKVPSLNVGTWYNLPDGVDTLKDEHLRGQILMVEFWATW